MDAEAAGQENKAELEDYKKTMPSIIATLLAAGPFFTARSMPLELK